MIYKISPRHGKKNPLVYISICSAVGSITVMGVKAFGIALKLTFAGHNQFSHPSTYAFAIVLVVCILTQLNYFNKALSQFSTSVYVCDYPLIGLGVNNRQRQSSLLRHIYDIYAMRILHPVQRIQHHRRRQHHLAPLRLPRHLHRRLPLEPLPHRPRRP